MDDKKRAEIEAGIKNGARWKEFYESLSDNEKASVSLVTSQEEFNAWAQGRNLNPSLWKAREDYYSFKSEPVKTTTISKPQKTPGTQRMMGSFEDLRDWNVWGVELKHEDFKKFAEDEAWKKATEWNKNRDKQKGESFLQTQQAEEDKLYDKLVKERPELARQWEKELSKRREKNTALSRAIERDNREKARRKDKTANENVAKDSPERKQELSESLRRRSDPWLLQKERREDFAQNIDRQNQPKVITRQIENSARRHEQKITRQAGGVERRRSHADKQRREIVPSFVPTRSVGLGSGLTNTVNRVFSRPRIRSLPRVAPAPAGLGRSVPNPFSRAGFGRFSLQSIEKQFVKAGVRYVMGSVLGAGLLTFLTAAIVLAGIGGGPGGGQTVSTAPTAAPSPGVPPPEVTPPPCDQIDSVLLSSFGITITGDSADCRAKEIAFTTYSALFQSEKYATLVRNVGGTTITMTGGACKGRASGDNFRIGDCSNSSLPYFFTHEMGHVIRNNATVDSAFNNALPSLVDSDKNCYDGNFLKTYLLRTGVNPRSESFAEAIALYYLGKRTRGVGAPITNFKTQCPATYSLIKDLVFGGYEFNGGSVPPGGTGSENTGRTVTVEVRKGTITTTYRSSNTCNGTYDLSDTHKFPIGNFGDPNCDFSKDALNDLIRRLDPGRFCGKSGKCYDRLDVWNGIIRCESGYRPNAINRQIGRTGGSGWGAWGLFQMNPDFANRATHDNGTVEWRTQVENAITRNNNTGGGFRYWSCAGGFRRGTR